MKSNRTVFEMFQRKIDGRRLFLQSSSAHPDKIRGELEVFDFVSAWMQIWLHSVKIGMRTNDIGAVKEATNVFTQLLTEESKTNAQLANAGVQRARGALSALEEIEPILQMAYDAVRNGQSDELI
jgi:hypothetical protein